MKNRIGMILALLPLSALAGSFSLVDGKSRVHFDATGTPSALKIHGEGKALSAEGLSQQSGQLSGVILFNLDSLATGINTRDHHMKEKYLETGKFPTARLRFSKVDLGADDATFPAELTLHGVTKPILVHRHATKGSDGTLHFESDFALKLSDYGIAIPKFAGITVAEDVKIQVGLEGRPGP